MTAPAEPARASKPSFWRDVASQALGGFIVVMIVFLLATFSGQVNENYARGLLISAVIVLITVVGFFVVFRRVFLARSEKLLDRIFSAGPKWVQIAVLVICLLIAIALLIGSVIQIGSWLSVQIPAILDRLFEVTPP
ncbi:MAG: hypothetical protein ABI632_12265 [Pseudolysinimonas sp.]